MEKPHTGLDELSEYATLVLWNDDVWSHATSRFFWDQWKSVQIAGVWPFRTTGHPTYERMLMVDRPLMVGGQVLYCCAASLWLRTASRGMLGKCDANHNQSTLIQLAVTLWASSKGSNNTSGNDLDKKKLKACGAQLTFRTDICRS